MSDAINEATPGERSGLEAIPRPPGRARLDWRPLAIPALVAAFFVWWNWGIWADPIVDFGRELYVPWRLNEGEALGRDIAWFNGPLSQHFNASLFAIFGTSLRTIVISNLVLVVITMAVLYKVLREHVEARSACIGVLSFVSLCAFSQHEALANFNWLCPYSHEITHGVLLGLVVVLACGSWITTPRRRSLVLAGFACGLCFLTKPETFLAASAALIASVTFAQIRLGRRSAVDLAAVLGAGLVPVVVAFAYLSAQSDASTAWALVRGAWKHVGDPRLSELLFYKSSLGLDEPGERLAIMASASAAWIGLVALVYGLGRLASARPALEMALAAIAFLAITAGVAFADGSDDQHRVFEAMYTPLPLVMLACALVASGRAWRSGLVRDAVRLPFVVFALLLLAKLGINARIYHYGFALAVPALALTVALATEAIPVALSRRRAAIRVTRAGLTAACLGAAILGFRINEGYRSQKIDFVGQGADKFRAVDGSWRIQMMLDHLRNVPAEATVLALPEGITLNYLMRRRTPIRVINFMPPELIMFGEREIVDELNANAPAYVLCRTRLTNEYGVPMFGTDYAQSITEWLRKNYEVVERASLGPDPFDPARVEDVLIGWRLWKRKP